MENQNGFPYAESNPIERKTTYRRDIYESTIASRM